MPKYLVFLDLLMLILIDSIGAPKPYECIHNQVSLPDVPAGDMTFKKSNMKRHTHKEDKYHPLRIYTYIDEIDPIIPRDVLQTVNFALKSMELYFEETVKVKQTFNPFLLERTSCVQKWKTGRNKGKCSRAKVNIEFCSMKETDYIIDDRFLDGLEVYDTNGVYPSLILPSGRGVRDVNFFLFVISRSSSWCKKDGVQAYGSYCRLDSENRPVAGLINLCPEFFSRKFYSTSYYSNVIMHEMMHILGFSSHLYPKFRQCTRENLCTPPKRIVVTDKHKVQRLVLPDVISAMQNHLQCPDEDLGGPLEKTDKSFSSHWHPLLMYTSLMVPVILEQDYTVLDNISLAVLSSTGWYLVNFSKADAFAFGKDGGCDFGYKETCEDSANLCTSSKGASGCDLLQYTIGKCEEITPTHPCGIYRPDSLNQCKDAVSSFRGGVTVRNSYLEHRCIMLQHLNDTNFEPTCVLIKCRKHKEIELYINSTWVSCKPDTMVTVNNVTAKCLDEFAVCDAPRKMLKKCAYDEELALSVRIYFSDPSFETISSNSDFHDFKGSTLKAIALSLNIPVNYIVNATLVVVKTVFLEFGICPPEELSDEEFNLLVLNVQQFLKTTSFGYIFQYHGYSNLPVSSTQYT